METISIFLGKFGNAIVDIALDAGVFMLFGFAIAGVLHAFVSATRIQKYLGTGRFGSVLRASLIGLPLPLCSCGVLPAAMALRKNGASKGATISFLISTPETGVDSIAISFALLDPVMAIFRPIAAFITALFTGTACDFVKEKNGNNDIAFHENACCSVYYPESRLKIVNRLHHGMRFAFIDMFDDLGKWLVIGILIAAAIEALVPAPGLFGQYVSNNFLQMLVMLVVAIPLYVCSTTATPLAASLIFAGISPGAALVLLLAGPATNAAGITVVARHLGLKTTAVYLAGIAVVSIGMGLLLNGVYAGLYGPHFQASAVIGKTAEMLPEWLRIAGAVLLTAGLLWSLGKQAARLARGEKITRPCDSGAHELNPDNPCNEEIAAEFKCKCNCRPGEEHKHDHTDHAH